MRRSERMLNISNSLTIFRFLLVPLTIVAIGYRKWDVALVNFSLAAATDMLDGYIARRYDQMSDLGAILDPLADKAMLTSTYIALGIMDMVPLWLPVLIAARDLMIVGAFLILFMISKPLEIKPLSVSKLSTALQFIFAIIILSSQAFNMFLPYLNAIFYILIVVTIAISLGAYLMTWLRAASR